MRQRLIPWLAALSLAGITPAALGGQSVATPRNFQAFRQGDDIVARWSAASEADYYIGEIDEGPQFDSPRRFAVEDDGRRTFEHRLRDLSPDVYYVRLRALRSFVVIRRQSDWTHVERVAIGADGRWDDDELDVLDRRGDDLRRWPRDGRTFPASDDFPRRLDARALRDDIRIAWSPVAGATEYLVQVDDEARFRDPFAFRVTGGGDRNLQQLVIRNASRDRYYVRVRVEGRLGRRDRSRWSEVETVDVGFGRDGDFRREPDLRDGRDGIVVGGRGHPVFDEHPGRGRGKGHLKHEDKRRGRGHERDGDWEDRDGDWEDRDDD